MADSTKSQKRPSSGRKRKGAGGAKAKAPASRKSQKKPEPKPSEPEATEAVEPEAAEAVEPDATEFAEELPEGTGANAALAGKAALEGTRAAGKAVTVAVSKIKIPLALGGGLAAGAAGGLALVRRRNGHRRRGDLAPVISAAKRAGAIGEELGRMAAMAEKASGTKGK